MRETKWRVGTKVPLNVYEGDRPVCQCHTAEDAARIVAAMTSVPQLRATLEATLPFVDGTFDGAMARIRAARAVLAEAPNV